MSGVASKAHTVAEGRIHSLHGEQRLLCNRTLGQAGSHHGAQGRRSVVRSASASTLGSLSHCNGTDIKDAMPALIECLPDTDANVRFLSVMALGYLGPDAAADAISP